MYFCIGTNNEIVMNTRRLPIRDIGFEFSITVEDGTLSIHWYRTVDRKWSFDFPWRPQLVDVQHKVLEEFSTLDSRLQSMDVTSYEVRERFVPWCLRNITRTHRFFGWRCSIAIGYERDGETQFRRIRSLDSWLHRNDLEKTIRVPKRRDHLSLVPTPASKSA